MAKELDAVAADMLKLFGANADADPLEWLDMGYPPLNKILSGFYDKGLPYGLMAEIFGPSASGKTVIGTMAMTAAQRAGGVGILVDWERAFKTTFAAEMGMNITHPHFVHLFPKTWEEGNMQALAVATYLREKKAIPERAPIVIVYDSIAAAIPKSKMYDSKGKLKPLDETTMNDTTALARATSGALPSVVQWFKELNVIGIYLNQVRTKPGVTYGSPEYTPGGVAPAYFSSTRLSITQTKVMAMVDGAKEFTGRNISIESVKSKNTRPFQTCELRLMYDDRDMAKFDFTHGLIEHLVELGIIKKDGLMNLWDEKKYYTAALARKLDSEADGWARLVALLPK